MNTPDQTPPIVVANRQAILLSSIHSGYGTASNWGLASEHLDFADMDFAPISLLL